MQVAVNRANILMSGNYLFAHMDTFASRLGRGGPPVKEKKHMMNGLLIQNDYSHKKNMKIDLYFS